MESEPAGYRAPAAPGRAEIRERGSRFLALVMPAGGPESARRALAEVRRAYPDATHHAWAWRLGAAAEEASSDAGEPPGTAGAPLLQVLRGAELSDVLVVVVRWFGGTKLGKGGLARAYAAAARAAVDGLATTLRVPTVALAVELPYARLGAVKRLVHPPRVEIVGEAYGAVVRLVLAVEAGHRGALERSLAALGLEAREVAAGAGELAPRRGIP